LDVKVGGVEVIVLDGRRHSSCGEFGAQGRKARSEIPQLLNLAGIQWQVAAHEILVASGQRPKTHVGHAAREVLVGMRRLPQLELGIPRQGCEPGFWWVPSLAERRPRIGEK
jgi:hypothetical protein